MKITLSGSLGHISRPLANSLLQKKHTVTIITSSAERRQEIEAIGARAAVGSLHDADFITSSFAGADAVYCMIPPANYWDQELDLLDYYQTLGHHYAAAINDSGVRRVVNLSSIGAHLPAGNGILRGAYYVEQILNDLPAAVAMTHIRPTEFYYNLLAQVPSAKHHGFLASNVGNAVVNSWVSPQDIAHAVEQELLTSEKGRKVRYVASDEVTYDELAAILGRAIGKPDLKWVALSDAEMRAGLSASGMQPAIADLMTEMYTAIDSGLLYENYNLQKPVRMGEVKVEDFAREFAAAYQRTE